MPKLPEEVLFDVRLVERHIRAGLVTRKEYEEHLKKLEDMTEQGDVLNLEELGNN
jgi:hypothetical protein